MLAVACAGVVDFTVVVVAVESVAGLAIVLAALATVSIVAGFVACAVCGNLTFVLTTLT